METTRATKLSQLIALGAVGILGLTACVPKAEQAATPSSATFEAFEDQEIAWSDCENDTECAIIEAPLDWSTPDVDGETVEIYVARKPALSANPKGTIFINPGGPGASGVEYLQNSDVAEELRADYNIAAWDPRGVGSQGSSVMCVTDSELDEMLFGEATDTPEAGTEAWLEQVRTENAELAAGCEEMSGDLYEHVSTADTVADLELLRQLVGDEKLNYLGFSYGTYIGAQYADTYPEKVGHLVLDGALDPTADTQDVVVAQTKGFELALTNYLTDCVSRDCWFSGSVDDGKQIITELLQQVEQNPLTGSDGRQVDVGTFITAIATPLYSESNWPILDDLFAEVRAGGAETALYLADFYYDRNSDGSYASNSYEAFIAINCLDYTQQQPNLEQMRANAEELASVAPILGPYQGYSEASCWGWPAQAAETRDAVTASGSDPILVIGTTGDPATPYEWAVSLAAQLENATLLTYNGEGHTAYGSSECINKAVQQYFVSDTVPNPDTQC